MPSHWSIIKISRIITCFNRFIIALSQIFCNNNMAYQIYSGMYSIFLCMFTSKTIFFISN